MIGRPNQFQFAIDPLDHIGGGLVLVLHFSPVRKFYRPENGHHVGFG